MSQEDGWNDEAGGACAVLALELRLPVVHQPGEDDRRVHEAWKALSTVPETIRKEYMAEHGIPEAAWEAWEALRRITEGLPTAQGGRLQ